MSKIDKNSIDELIIRAKEARERAYAPYSKFKVGAALRTIGEKIYWGCNVENIAYPQGQCAEASALSHMISHGERKIKDIVILADGSEICTPCGGCRQKLAEFADTKTMVHLCKPQGIIKSIYLHKLLPLSFKFKSASLTQDINYQLISLIDLTSLGNNDTPQTIHNLYKKGQTLYGPVAALCIDPKFIKLAKRYVVDQPMRLATVANFPLGTDPFKKIITQVQQSLKDGAEEIDLVFPYKFYLENKNNKKSILHLIQIIKNLCGPARTLKIILETGVLKQKKLIEEIAQLSIEGGTNFLKTSTGKIGPGATLPAVKILLDIIYTNQHQIQHPIGLKISGGIRNKNQALEFIHLITQKMGEDWIHPANLRIGASSLLDNLLENKKTSLQSFY
ncbi:MAG: deoxyribose-phosphate aldolase [Alphaproteobacteria bacterium]|nr:deoxyribose-phosphate aldolase [Alphaproteobacteria bacterium]